MKIRILIQKPDHILYYVRYNRCFFKSEVMNKIVFIGVIMYCHNNLVVQRHEFYGNNVFNGKTIIDRFLENWEI